MGLYAQSLKADEPAKSAAETPAGKTWLEDILTRSKLTGDWRGLRTDLSKHGIDFDLRLSQFYQSVTNGGVNTNDEYGGKIDYRLNVNANKLFGLWKGLYANVHVETRYGYDILADAGGLTLPNTPMLYPLPGKYHDTKLTGALIMQYLFEGRVALFAGKLHAVDLVTAIFPHVGYGQEGFWNVSSLISALPWFRFVNLSMWGGGGWTIKDKQIQGGLIAFGQENVTTTNSFSDSFSDGVGILAFWRFFYKIADKPGSVLLFAGGATKDYPSLERTSWGFIPGEGLVDDKSKKPWDVAAYIQQVFWQAENDDKRNAQIFMGGTWGNDDPNFSNWNIFANIEAFGPMARRPNDRMGIAGYFNGITTDLKHLTSTIGLGVRDIWGFEAYYNFEITPWMHLTGDIQLIENGRGHDDLRFIENGSRGDSTAVIPGIRLVIDF
jgi:porin